MRNLRIVWSLIVIGMSGLFTSCSTTPTKTHHHEPVSQEEMQDLNTRFQEALIEELNKNKEISKINEVKVMESKQDKEGKIQISYALSYESKSKDAGNVTRKVEAVAFLERVSENQWKITQADRTSESLVFQDPLVIKAAPPQE